MTYVVMEMNKLITEVGRILDFTPEYISLIISEADNKEKLRNTYMFVNGKLQYIKAFQWDFGKVVIYNVMDDTSSTITVETLEPWLPLSGLYVSDSIAVYIEKRAHKQWRKSFVFDNYKMDFIKVDKTKENKVYQTLSTMEPVPMAIIGNKVYFHSKVIGRIEKDNLVKCINYQFYQELVDFSNRKELNWMIQ